MLWREIVRSVCVDRAVFYDRKWIVRGLLAVPYTPAGAMNGIVIVRATATLLFIVVPHAHCENNVRRVR